MNDYICSFRAEFPFPKDGMKVKELKKKKGSEGIKKRMSKCTRGEEACRENSGREVWYLSGILKEYFK